MQQGDADLRQPPPPFHCQGGKQLVLSRLGRPVGIPAAEPVVTDAANAGREAGEMAALVPWKQWFDRLGQQQRSPGVDREAALQVGPAHLAEPLLGLQLSVVQQPGAADHKSQGSQPLSGQCREALKAGLILEIERQVAGRTWPTSRGPQRQPRSLGRQSLGQGGADTSGTDDQGVTPPVAPGLLGRVHAVFRSRMAHDGRSPEEERLRITLLGRGAWGSTLAHLWRDSGHELVLWSRRDGGSAAPLLVGSELVVAAVSMSGISSLARDLAPHWPDGLPLLSCSKGIDPERLGTATQLWGHWLGPLPLAVLSGPNLADELDRGLPAASVIASRDVDLARRLQRALRTPNLRLYTNDDPIGTEAAGALKNVMAVAAGISDGLGLGANAKASLLTRGLAEMALVLAALGGQPPTLYGLAGLGDLLATANSPLSRNYRFGGLLAQGRSEAAALAEIAATVEGPRTARATLELAGARAVTLPICEQVVQLLDGQCDAPTAVRRLMDRDLRPEAQR